VAYQGTPPNIRKGIAAGRGLQPAATAFMLLDNGMIHTSCVSLFVCLFACLFVCLLDFSTSIKPYPQQLKKPSKF
jgi:hypothetical protein